jgi:hypothetical protein
VINQITNVIIHMLKFFFEKLKCVMGEMDFFSDN